MAEKKSTRLFDRIAPVYGLFYARQKRRYARIADQVKDKMDVDAFQSALDVGCGTGAWRVANVGWEITTGRSASRSRNTPPPK